MNFFYISFIIIIFTQIFSVFSSEINEEINEIKEFNIPKEKQIDVDKIMSDYFLKLIENKVLSIKDLENYVISIEKKLIFNPFDCNENNQHVCKSSNYLLHRDGFSKIIKNKKINKDNIINYLNIIIKESKKNEENKKEAIRETEDLDIMDFAYVPPGDYRIFYKLERVGPPQENVNITSVQSEIPYMPFQSIKEYLDDLLFSDINIPKTYYRFPKLKLKKGFELATTLVTEKLYLQVMEENPSYSHNNVNPQSSKSIIINNYQKSNPKENEKIINYNYLYPVTNLKTYDADEFIKKLNTKIEMGDKEILKILGTDKKCFYDLINKEQYNYIKYLYFKDNYIYKQVRTVIGQIKIPLEDALFFQKENILMRNEYRPIDIDINGKYNNEILEILFPFNIEMFYLDNQRKMRKLFNVRLKISPPVNQNFDLFWENAKTQKKYSSQVFKINNFDIYDLFYNKFIFIRSNNSILHEIFDIKFKNNLYFEFLFRGYADEKNFNDIKYSDYPYGHRKFSIIDEITIKEDENISNPYFIKGNTEKYNLMSGDNISPHMGIRLVRYCE